MRRECEIDTVAGDRAVTVVEDAARRGEGQERCGGAALLEAAEPIVDVGGVDAQVTGDQAALAVVEAAVSGAADAQRQLAGRGDAAARSDEIAAAGNDRNMAALGGGARQIHAAATVEDESARGEVAAVSGKGVGGGDDKLAAAGETAVALDAGTEQAGGASGKAADLQADIAGAGQRAAVIHEAGGLDAETAGGVKRARVDQAADPCVEAAAAADLAKAVEHRAAALEHEGAGKGAQLAGAVVHLAGGEVQCVGADDEAVAVVEGARRLKVEGGIGGDRAVAIVEPGGGQTAYTAGEDGAAGTVAYRAGGRQRERGRGAGLERALTVEHFADLQRGGAGADNAPTVVVEQGFGAQAQAAAARQRGAPVGEDGAVDADSAGSGFGAVEIGPLGVDGEGAGCDDEALAARQVCRGNRQQVVGGAAAGVLDQAVGIGEGVGR